MCCTGAVVNREQWGVGRQAGRGRSSSLRGWSAALPGNLRGRLPARRSPELSWQSPSCFSPMFRNMPGSCSLHHTQRGPGFDFSASAAMQMSVFTLLWAGIRIYTSYSLLQQIYFGSLDTIELILPCCSSSPPLAAFATLHARCPLMSTMVPCHARQPLALSQL